LAPSPAQIHDAYVHATDEVRRRILAYTQAAWHSLDQWRTPDIERFVRKVVPVVTGGQVRVANLTDAYLAAMATNVLGVATRPVGIPTSTVNDSVMRGVTTADVYRRTGPAVWSALAAGAPLDDAVHQGLTRALVTAGTDLQLARTHATRYSLSRDDRVVGYQRIPDGGACELCLLASTQRYRGEDLMPIHNRCGCDVEPLFGDGDTGQIIDHELLDRINTARSSGTSIAVEDHGELGPVLTVAGQSFTGPSDI
jgi:hypothetical protein